MPLALEGAIEGVLRAAPALSDWNKALVREALHVGALPELWSTGRASLSVALEDLPPLALELRAAPPPAALPGDVIVPYAAADDLVALAELGICEALQIQDLYDVPDLRDQIGPLLAAAYAEVVVSGVGVVQGTIETAEGPRTYELRLVRG